MTGFTAEDRKRVKREAKAHVGACKGKCIGIWFLYLLPIFLLQLIAQLVTMPFNVQYFQFMLSAADGASGMLDSYALNQMANNASNISFLISLVSIAICSPMVWGLQRFLIRLSRGEEIPVSTIFQEFSSLHKIWRSIRLYLCYTFRTTLWMLIPSSVLCIGLITLFVNLAFTVYGGHDPGLGFLLALVVLLILFFIGVLLCSAKTITYSLGYAVCQDDELIGVWAAVSVATRRFTGMYSQMLAFLLSFTPWFLLFVAVPVVPLIFIFIASSFLPTTTFLIALIIWGVLILVWNVTAGGLLSSYQAVSLYSLFDFLAPPADPAQAQGPNLLKDQNPGGPADGQP